MGRVLAMLAAGVVACAAPAPALAYGWPLKPFDAPHPIRGIFDDPREHTGAGGSSHSFHFGIDIPAAGGTPVYAVAAGTVYRYRDAVAVVARPHEFSYWHVDPAVAEHAHVERQQLIGWVRAVWAHVHFAELVGGKYVNPLRPGALSPFEDHTVPAVARIALTEGADGRFDLTAIAQDRPPLPLTPPWQRAVLAPALVRWRLVANGVEGPWRTAADFRLALQPPARYDVIYAPGTRQNHPDRPGRLRFWLARDLALATGSYRIDVEARDTRDNVGTGSAMFTLKEGGRG